MSQILTRPYDVSDAPTLEHYITDIHTPFCAVMSHVNSGKTTAMVMKVQLIAANQHPDINGIRRSSHVFVRGTHGDLLRGIIRSFEERVSPELVNIRKTAPSMGKLSMQPLYDQNKHFPEYMIFNGKRHAYKLGGWDPDQEQWYEDAVDVSGKRIGDIFPNGTYVDAQFDFVALDNPDWEAILLGTNYTTAAFDEPDSMSNIHELLPKIPTRTGRYPPAETAPVTCSQVNLAYNPPKRKSFTQEFFHPKNEHLGRKLYRMQPPFLLVPDSKEPNNFFKAEFIRNPDAEGIRYAPKGIKHWEDIINSSRHDPDKIRRDVLGEYTYGSGGDLIHTEFNRDEHVVDECLPERNYVLFVSLDHGSSGACLIGQYKNGGLQVIEEISADGNQAHIFVKDTIIPHLRSEYIGYDIVITGDPSGKYPRDVGDGPFSIFEERGYLVEADISNDPEERWSAVDSRLKIRGGLQISEACEMLIEGFEGEYTYKKQKPGQVLKQTDKRKPHSAYQDCLQAMCQIIEQGVETAATASRRHQEEEQEEESFLWY